MRSVAAVDVSGSDFGDRDISVDNRYLGAVVCKASDALQVTRLRTVEHDDLAPSLAVHPHVSLGLFDDPVGLACDHVTVIAQTDVQTLTTPPQCEEERLWCCSGGDSNGDRTLERRHRATEGLGWSDSVGEVARHQCRDHFGVGGNRCWNPQGVLGA